MTLADPFCQRNPLWAARPLGTKGTISQYGCLLCVVAHAAAESIPGLTPWELNQRLLENNGFENGNLVRHDVAARLMGCRYAEGEDYVGPFPLADLAKIEDYLASGFVFVKVNYNVGGKLAPHWLRLLSREHDREPGGRSICYDPWYGEVLPYMESHYSPGNKRGPAYAWWGWRAYRRI